MAAAAVQAPVLAGPVGQPDISYAPILDIYEKRTKKRLEDEKLDKSLPEGFPTKLESDLVWDGTTLAETYDWNYVLTQDNIAEIDEALKHFKCKFLSIS